MACTSARASDEQPLGPQVREFLAVHCFDCHQGTEAEAGLDLATLQLDLTSADAETQWITIFDRVNQGEMPPRDAGEVDSAEAADFLQATETWLRQHQTAEAEELGRVRARQLTRREVERSLQDLLGIDIPLADQLPEEANSAEFSTVANSQTISHFQLERHLAVVDVALDEAFRRALTPEDQYFREFNARQVARRSDRTRTREPEILDGQAVVWSSGLIFYGRLPATTAPESGWYRFKVRASSLKQPSTGGVWATVRSGLCVSSAPLLAWITAFEATPKPKDIEFEAWLPKGHMLEIRPGDATLKKARFAGGQVGSGEGGPQNVPGIAIDEITMERIHHGASDAETRELLFGDIAVKLDSKGRGVELISASPHDDVERLLEAFGYRAFRRPVSREDLAKYFDLAHAMLDDGQPMLATLRAGYRAMLCSPRFLYLTETPGKLDDHAIAARLSYLLTGSMPDARLSALADEGRLGDANVLHAEVERLLAGDGGRRFVQDFAAEWLDLDQIDFTQPDGKLVPEFDPIVQASMLDETHTFLATMLAENLSVTNLITSNFTFLNSRLARYYDIDNVSGDELRRIDLLPEHHRGGVLTQGAVLKVTANGSNTSPVIRGVWISERLLGVPIPPPPTNVPAIEPDIRGAKTIREMLAKHRSQDSCASCHVKIDPPGFALENYDPAGRWRDKYLQVIAGRAQRGAVVDASYTMPDGREFHDVNEFRSLVVGEPEKLARNVAEKLIAFGTGAPISFADRQSVDEIVAKAANESFGFRSIVHAVVASSVFQTK